MKNRSPLNDYKRSIAEYLEVNQDQVFLFWKGRVALYAILKACGIKPGDEILMPAFTCVVVPNACLYLGARPVYVDIEPGTFNMDPEKVEEKITGRTRVILAQNTYGLSPDLDKLQARADKHKLLLVEDCTHGFGGLYKGKKNGTLAAASFFSTQWNKPFSTGIGGFAVIRDCTLLREMKMLEEQAFKPSRQEEFLLNLQLWIKRQRRLQKFYWLQVKFYRFLTHHKVIPGSSSGDELGKPAMPVHFLKGMSNTQALAGISELGKMKYNLAHRQMVASGYKEMLLKLHKDPPAEPVYATHTFIKYTILVRDRERFLKAAEKEGVELGDWFVSPIHPVLEHFEWWNYRYGDFPVAEYASAHTVNLPTHLAIDKNELIKIRDFLEKNRKDIFDKW